MIKLTGTGRGDYDESLVAGIMKINESDIYPHKASDFSDRDCIVAAPHPGDESIGCGGSIIKHVRKGQQG